MPVNLSQYRGSVGIFNNRNFFVQSKVSHFWYLSDNNSNNNYKGYVYDFSVDYNSIAVSDILDIHKYLKKKNEIV